MSDQVWQVAGGWGVRHLEPVAEVVPERDAELGADLYQLLSQRSVANALLPPIRLTSPSGPDDPRRYPERPYLGVQPTKIQKSGSANLNVGSRG